MVPMNEFDKWLYHRNSPGKWEHQLPPWRQVNWVNHWRVIVILTGFVAGIIIPFAISIAISTNARSALDWLESSELISALLITLMAVVGAGVSLAVFELIRYLIRKRRTATSVLLEPPQGEIEIWKVDDRRYEQAKARLLQRQKDRGEDS